jgi:uncharacterized protein (DUF486 family)
VFKVVLVSWLMASLEYCCQVPANRIGSFELMVVRLKTIREVITPTVFAIFRVPYSNAQLKGNHFLGFALLAVFVIFKQW